MSGNKRGNFPTGSSGGGGRRGYGRRNYNRDSNEANFGGGRGANFGGETSKNMRDKEKKELEELKEFKIWIPEGEGNEQLNVIRNSETPLNFVNPMMEATAPTNDFRQNHPNVANNLRAQFENDGATGWQNVAGYVPNTGGAEAAGERNNIYQQYVHARAYGDNNVNNMNFLSTSHVVGNWQRPEHDAGQDGRQVEVYGGPPREPMEVVINNFNLSTYVATILQAYVMKNGIILGNCLSVRNPHVFILINTCLKWPYVWQICNIPCLAEAILHHLEVLKALIYQNIQLAVYHQQLLVNLMNEHLERGEFWVVPVLVVTRYELDVLKYKQQHDPPRTATIRVRWTTTHAVYCMGVRGCYCQYLAYVLYRTTRY